ncbi:uncharacterized protein LOC129741902 [Uranotaenia lowii]|uniref:uncharacterized protein LOC129741902 n=1 Tax=Uranotaenia lowii TaxID=190385 RepID=UPI002478E966|nr:uncharacterized protein LOC129741902 [Uranotaenia lowii]
MAAPATSPGVATTGDPPDKNDRTLPEYLDRSGNFGKLIILSLCPADEKHPLPKNPFVVSKSLDQSIGKIEAAYTEQNGTKYVIKTRSSKLAAKLTQMSELIDGTKIRIIPHPVFNVSRCVISCKEACDLKEEELQEELASQGVLKVRRITRMENKSRVNTPTIVLTISGTVIPKEIRVGIINCRTRLFYPSPLVCYRCCAYGHTKDKCDSEPTCRNCSKQHELENEDPCQAEPFCKNCKGSHSPISRNCPIYRKEEEIVKTKVDSGITFGEARKEYARKHAENSYANVCGAQQRLETLRRDQEKDIQIAKLTKELADLKKKSPSTENDEITRLRKEVENLRIIAKEFYIMKAKLKTAEEHLEISESESEIEMETEQEQVERSSTARATPITVDETPTLKKQKLSSKNSLPFSMESDDAFESQSQQESTVKRRGRPPKNKNGQQVKK